MLLFIECVLFTGKQMEKLQLLWSLVLVDWRFRNGKDLKYFRNVLSYLQERKQSDVNNSQLWFLGVYFIILVLFLLVKHFLKYYLHMHTYITTNDLLHYTKEFQIPKYIFLKEVDIKHSLKGFLPTNRYLDKFFNDVPYLVKDDFMIARMFLPEIFEWFLPCYNLQIFTPTVYRTVYNSYLSRL